MNLHLMQWVNDGVKYFEEIKYLDGLRLHGVVKYFMIILLVGLSIFHLVNRPSQPPRKPGQDKSGQVTRQHHAPKEKDPVRALVDGEIVLSVDHPADELSTQFGERDADLAWLADDEDLPTASRHLAEGLDELFRALGPPPAPRPGDTDVVLVGDDGGQQ
ncbi:hypothetical protein [Streptomyces sp. CBMA156]|uniref:hypothetical protein n=1 Tax=Streptomyces sp. CBMA156 TaxID=1930280 RepID=UPI00166198DE|nr:hypothetical protein [Streptomyces sp. CBMA156]